MRAAGKQNGIQESSLKRAAETVETVQEAEVSAGTSEEVFQAEDEANQTAESSQRTEVLEQAAEKTVGAEEIVSESVEAEPAEMSENQNKQGGSVRQTIRLQRNTGIRNHCLLPGRSHIQRVLDGLRLTGHSFIFLKKLFSYRCHILFIPAVLRLLPLPKIPFVFPGPTV